MHNLSLGGLSLSGVAAIGFFYGLFLLLGMLAGRRKEATSTGLLLADRRLPLWIGICTMTATWVGGGYLNGTAEAVYDRARGLVWAQAPWGYALALVLGGLFFAGRMRREGYTTLLDVFERRYGRRVAAGLYLPALVGEVFWSAAILVALGTTTTVVLGLESPRAEQLLILVSAAVAIAYTLFGGLRAVAYTDTLQLFCIALGLGLAVPFALDHVGGLAEVLERYGQEFGPQAALLPAASHWHGPAADGWKWADTALLLMLGGIPWGVYFQRVLACPDERSAKRLSLVAGGACLLFALPAMLLGAVGATADWSSVGAAPPERAEMVLPHVLRHLTGPVIATIGLGAVAAAVMSSVDSSILSASSMFSWNIYRPLLRPAADDREVRLVIRIGILCVGSLAAALALWVGSVYTLWYLCSDLVYVVLFPQLVMALYFRRANWVGAVAGAAVGLLLRLGAGEATFGLPTLLPYPMQHGGEVLFPFRTFAMLSSLATIWLISLATHHRLTKRFADEHAHRGPQT